MNKSIMNKSICKQNIHQNVKLPISCISVQKNKNGNILFYHDELYSLVNDIKCKLSIQDIEYIAYRMKYKKNKLCDSLTLVFEVISLYENICLFIDIFTTTKFVLPFKKKFFTIFKKDCIDEINF